MPYIKPEDRERWAEGLRAFEKARLQKALTPGDMNYIFCQVALGFLQQNGKNYTNINAVIGALECCKLELYRRVAENYEQKKIEENGDIF